MLQFTATIKRFKEQASFFVQSDVRPNSRINLALYNLFNTKNGEYRTDRIKNIGEAPNLLDSALVEISRNEIEKFLKSKGFLMAEVKSDYNTLNNQVLVNTFEKEWSEYVK